MLRITRIKEMNEIREAVTDKVWQARTKTWRPKELNKMLGLNTWYYFIEIRD